MPLKSGTSDKTVSGNIRELHKGKTYARTTARFGKHRADKQAVAIALSEKRKSSSAKGRRPTPGANKKWPESDTPGGTTGA